MDGLEGAVLDAPVLEPLDEGFDGPLDDPKPEPQADGDVKPEEKIDGRKFNPEWSKNLKTLREQHPEYADMLNKLRDETARQLRFRELAPGGLEDARGWKTAIDAAGGPEALAELQTRAATMEAVDAKILAGDDTVFDDLGEDLGKGLLQMAPAYLNRLATQNPEAFNQAVAPHFQRALAGTGMGVHFEKMEKALEAGDGEQLAKLLGQGKTWYKEQTEGVGTMPEGKPQGSPREQALAKQLEEINQGKEQEFIKSTSDSAVKYKDEQYTKLAAPYIKQLGLTDTQQADLLDSYNIKIVSQLQADTAFQKQLAAYKGMKTRNPEQIDKYIRETVDKYAKPTIDSLVTARYGKQPVRRATPAADATPTTNNGILRVATRPPDADIDWDAMTGRYDLTKKGTYVLKTGKIVQVVK